MKYTTIIETDDYKDFEFFEDCIGKYMVGKDPRQKVVGYHYTLQNVNKSQRQDIGYQQMITILELMTV